MLYNKPLQISIDAPRLSDSIVNNQDSVFTSKPGLQGTTFKLDCGYYLYVF